eukprot:scaffold35402_cov49-Attheya_sp.AAC.1
MLPSNLILRSYRPEDHDACEWLEVRANQFRNSKLDKLPIVGNLLLGLKERLVQVHQGHPKGFDARAKTADDHEIVVCEDLEEDGSRRVIAVVAVNIRSVLWKGVTIRVGWVYDLRVDQDYQRQGIARVLSQDLERRCLEKGVSMLHLTVNLDNTKAKCFYQALGYQHASHRAPCTKFLVAEETLSTNVVVFQPNNPELAAVWIKEFYENIDMAPSNGNEFLKLLTSVNCEGTFVGVHRSNIPDSSIPLLGKGREDDLSSALQKAIQSGEIQSYGGVSLWNASAMKSIKLVRLGVSKKTWISAPFQAALFAAFMMPMALWGSSLFRRIWNTCVPSGSRLAQQKVGEESSSSIVSLLWIGLLLVGETGAILIVSRMLLKASRFFRFIASRDSNHLSSRAFATFHRGPNGLDCLTGALCASRICARSKGYGLWILNVADGHPDAQAFPKPGFKTLFLQKWLTKNANHSNNPSLGSNNGKTSDEWPEFSKAAFCNPQDL